MSIEEKEKYSNKLFLLIALALILIVATKLYLHSDYKEQQMSDNSSVKFLIYSKDNCSYCKSSKDLLDRKGITYEIIDITNNQDLRSKLVAQTGHNTVPYIFADGKFIGGYMELTNFLSD